MIWGCVNRKKLMTQKYSQLPKYRRIQKASSLNKRTSFLALEKLRPKSQAKHLKADNESVDALIGEHFDLHETFFQPKISS